MMTEASAFHLEPAVAPGSRPRGPDFDDPRCIRCGYSLIGLDSWRPCPECGLLSELSLLSGEALPHNRPRWLKTLCVGAVLMAAGLFTLPLVIVSCGLIAAWRFSRAGGPGAPIGLAGALGIGLGAGALTFVGGWLVTRHSARYAFDREHLAWRASLRAVAAVPALIPLGVLWATRGNVFRNWVDDWWFAIMGLLLAPMPYLLFAYLRRLAARAPARRLAADSPVIGALFSGILILPLVITILSTFLDPVQLSPDAFGRYTTALAALYAVFLIGLPLLWLWSIYLLIRYAIAFGKTAGQARQLMADFDASRNPAASAYDSPP